MATATKAAKAVTAARKAAPAKRAPRAAAESRARPSPVLPPAAAPVVDIAKEEKPKKPKLVRDSFTIPKAEYAVLQQLKQRASKSAMPAKKSELLRAGIKALAAMGDAAFAAALRAVPALKTGRPRQG